ncbi:MAG: membrane dipeptidase [Oscillospiraceae bacterium]|nr:membrane dipeptidase [Oscillospiraceae bacterium]
MIPYFDAHCDTAMPVHDKGGSLWENGFQLDLKRLSAYAPCAQVFALCVAQGGGMAGETERVLDTLLGQLAANAGAVRLCRSAAELDAAAGEGKIAALISIEGADRFNCDLERLRALFGRGVRIVHLTWNHDTALAGAAMDSGGGLTAYGREFVASAQGMGIVLDLSHLSERGFWDVLDIAQKPVLAGHSNARALCDHPRNLTDGQFLALMKQGGVAGLNFYENFLGLGRDLDAIVAHAEHWLGLGGEKAVCLGGDLDGIPHPPAGMDGAESVGEVYNAMLRKNWNEGLVRDIFYNNLREFFGRAL